MSSRTIAKLKVEFEKEDVMVVVLGDWNAHTCNIQEQCAQAVGERVGDIAHPINKRGEALLQFMNQNQLVMTNGRLDNSQTDMLDLYTRKRMTTAGEQRTLIYTLNTNDEARSIMKELTNE